MTDTALSPEKVQEWESAYQAEELDEDDKAFWVKVREHYLPPPPGPQPTPEPVPTPAPPRLRPTFTNPDDPRASSDWYSQAWDRFVRPVLESYGRGSGLPEEGTAWGPPVLESTTPGEARDARLAYQQTQSKVAREVLENAPSLLPFTWGPRAAATATRWAPWLVQKAVPLLKRGATMFGVQDLAVRAANVADPWNTTNPEVSAALNAGGEMLGGVGEDVLRATGRLIRRPWQETVPEGTMHREVITDLGGKVMPGMVSEEFMPKTFDMALQHTPFGGVARGVYKETQKRLDAELLKHKAQHPGGKVTTEAERLAAEVQGLATPGSLQTGPALAREAMDTMPGVVEKNLKQGYSRLDANYLGRQIPWHFARNRLPYVQRTEHLLLDASLAGQVGEHSMFDDAVRVMQDLEQLPDQITLQTMLEKQRTLSRMIQEAQDHVTYMTNHPDEATELTSSIQGKLLPALGQAQQQINEQIAPYLVDLQAAKRLAQTRVDTWERSLQVPESMLQGQQAAGRQFVSEDPDVLAARGLLQQPNFVTFTEAHALRSQMLEVSRLRGPLIGDSPAKQGRHMADEIDDAMRVMGERLTPDLVPHWRVMDGQYKAAAQLYNSPYITGVATNNLDDMLTTLVQTGRPNDMKALRTALGTKPGGGDVLDDVAQMWLTRQIENVTPKSTGQLQPQKLLDILDVIPAETERTLFPRGLSGIRTKLRQAVDMEAAIAEVGKGARADPVALAQMKARIHDPALWEAVQSDVLAPMLTSGTDPIKASRLLDGLNNLPDKVREALFDPAHYRDLIHLAHTSRAVEEVSRRRGMTWSPLVRYVEHGLILTGLGYWAHDPSEVKTYALPVGYFLGTAGLARLLTNQRAVQLLTRGMMSAPTKFSWGEIVGNLLGQMHSMGIEEVVPITPQGTPAASPAAAP